MCRKQLSAAVVEEEEEGVVVVVGPECKTIPRPDAMMAAVCVCVCVHQSVCVWCVKLQPSSSGTFYRGDEVIISFQGYRVGGVDCLPHVFFPPPITTRSWP